MTDTAQLLSKELRVLFEEHDGGLPETRLTFAQQGAVSAAYALEALADLDPAISLSLEAWIAAPIGARFQRACRRLVFRPQS